MTKRLRPLGSLLLLLAATAAVTAAPATKEAAAPKSTLNGDTFAGLAFRSIGPAVTGGRVVAIAVDPTSPKRWFVAAGSGGVWRTTNAGTTWTPVFDREGSYSIGAVA